jgi:hypothetical protein
MQEVGQSIMRVHASSRGVWRGVWNDEDGDVLYAALRGKRVERGSRRMEDVLLKVSWTCNSLLAQLFERVFFEQLAPKAIDRHSSHIKAREGKRRKSKSVQLLFINSTLLACSARSAREEQRLYVCTYS